MKELETQKKKLAQKKNRIAVEETRLRLKERKARTRHLIELGGLVVKAELDFLPANTLYGALISLHNSLEQNNDIRHEWTKIGQEQFDQDQNLFTPIILQFD